MRKGSIVLGLGLGDEGKGLVTDYLCSQSQDPTIVVRFSGGHQAGHNVVIGDKSHIHSNFGSGTLRGIPSYTTEHCTIYLNTMRRELDKLESMGVVPNLTVHPLAKLTTPADVAYNRLMESKRKHGSVGLGVGATMDRNENTGYKLFALDLMHLEILAEKLSNIEKYYEKLVSKEDKEEYNATLFEESKFFYTLLEKPMFEIDSYGHLIKYPNIVFEGSQGILLDQDHGVFPNVTYSRTTSKNALLVAQLIGCSTEIYYVTRCYHTRHGNGWMSNNNQIKLINNEKETNITNPYQGEFKIGELDYSLLNYALEVDAAYSNNRVKNLVVTCLDQRPDFKFEPKQILTEFDKILFSNSPDSSNIQLANF